MGTLLVALLVASPFLAAVLGYRPIPTFAKRYYVKGIIDLPFADLNEPFEEWYDSDEDLSRRDYYGDLVQYAYKDETKYQLVWTDKQADGIPRRTCYKEGGSWWSSVEIESIIPSLDGYKFIDNEECPIQTNGVNNTCEKWEKDQSGGVETRHEHHSFYVTTDADGNYVPVYYRMLGTNPVLGTAYDRSEMFFHHYTTAEINSDVYDIAENYTCENKKGIHDYISDIVNYDYHGIDPEFDEYKNRHGKKYADDAEHEMRKNIFRQNHRFVHSTNRKQLSYKVELNHLADWTDTEYNRLNGLKLPKSPVRNGTIPFKLSKKKAPKELDWRLYGAVTPVKNQALCGSCWSFGTTGSTEGVYFVKKGELPSLSEQQLVDCAWFSGNNGCEGGLADWAWTYAMKAGGMSTEGEYGDYLMVDGKCHDKETKKLVKIKGFTDVPSDDITALKDALANKGPVAIAVNAGPNSFKLFASGVYDDSGCYGSRYNLNHQVLAIGYGKLDDKNYWLVKNSWGNFWGNDGYILIAEKNNVCGVLTLPSYPEIR